MESPKQSKFVSSLLFGLLTGFVLVILSVLLFATNQYNGGLKYLSYPILALGIVLGTLSYRNKSLEGYISYGKSMGFGVLISLFAGLVSGIFVMIYFKFINTGIVDDMMQKLGEEWANKGMKEEQIAVAEKYARMMFTPTAMLIISVISNVFLGTIISLISSIFIKKDRPGEMS
jgi:hypothetical protein